MVELGYKEPSFAKASEGKQNGLLEKPETHTKKLPAASYQLPDHFSYSQLAAFDKCPLQYKFAFILKVPTRGKAVFSFGKTIHATLHDFLKLANEGGNKKQDNLFGFDPSTKLRARDKGNLNLKDLTDIYEKNWIDEWYQTKKQKEEYYELGKKIIKEFYREFEKNPAKVLKINNALALEIPFNLKIGEHTLFGVIDRIDEQTGGGQGVAIFDYKTGTSKDKLDAQAKEQLLIYQIAAEEIFKIKPKELIYYYLNDPSYARGSGGQGAKKMSFIGTEKEKKELKEKIVQEIEQIKKSDFKPTPGWQCSYCDFRDICDFAER